MAHGAFVQTQKVHCISSQTFESLFDWIFLPQLHAPAQKLKIIYEKQHKQVKQIVQNTLQHKGRDLQSRCLQKWPQVKRNRPAEGRIQKSTFHY